MQSFHDLLVFEHCFSFFQLKAAWNLLFGKKIERLRLTNTQEDNSPNMEVKEATKPASQDQAEVPSLDQSQDAIEKMIEEAKPESQTNGTEAASNGASPKSPLEHEEKMHKEPEKKSPKHDEPSKRVREGQKWNDRPRKQFGNQNDRPHKRHNNKSDLVSQPESRDPDAIRKQVCIHSCSTKSRPLTIIT